MRRLSSVGFRSLAHRKGRSVLTGVGIALGVAILFGVLIANATVDRGFHDRFSVQGGRPDVTLSTTGDAPISMDLMGKVRGRSDIAGMSWNSRPGEPIERVNIRLRPGTDVGRWMAEVRPLTGPDVDVQPFSDSDNDFAAFLSAVEGALSGISAMALFVGAFLIYLTFSMAVLERTRLYGMLRALGATSRQVRRLVLAESLALGAVATLAGLVLGMGLAVALIHLLSRAVRIDAPGMAITPTAVVVSLIVGMGVSVASSLLPARRAARHEPVDAMRGDHGADARLSRTWILGVVALCAGIVFGVVKPSLALAPLGTLLILLGAVLLVPVLLRPLARAVGRVSSRVAPGSGDIPVMHLAKERSRSAYTLALLMVVLAMTFATGGASMSMRKGMNRVFDAQFGADVTVWGGRGLDQRLRAVPGVETVSPMRYGKVQVDGAAQRQNLVLIEPDTYFRVEGYDWRKGSAASAEAALRAGGAVLLPEGLARQLHVDPGEPVTLATRNGPAQFRVAATFGTYGFGGDTGVVAGVADAGRFKHGLPDGFRIGLRDDADPDAVVAAIRTMNVDEVHTAAGLKRLVADNTDRYFVLFYGVVFVALVIGLLGMANTLAMSVLQRTREVGVLRAIGLLAGQVRGMVLVESLTLGLVALVLSIPLGLVLDYLLISSTAGFGGFTVSFVYPWAWLAVIGVLAAMVAAIAALVPGRRAARIDVVAALRLE